MVGVDGRDEGGKLRKAEKSSVLGERGAATGAEAEQDGSEG